MESQHSRDVDPEYLGKELDACVRASRLAAVPPIPKFHAVRHFRALAVRAGNPHSYNCYKDEAKNADVVAIAQAACTPDFGSKILVRDALACKHETTVLM